MFFGGALFSVKSGRGCFKSSGRAPWWWRREERLCGGVGDGCKEVVGEEAAVIVRCKLRLALSFNCDLYYQTNQYSV